MSRDQREFGRRTSEITFKHTTANIIELSVLNFGPFIRFNQTFNLCPPSPKLFIRYTIQKEMRDSERKKNTAKRL